MIATEPIKLEKNWDATNILGEALLTNEPNDRYFLGNIEYDPEKTVGFYNTLKFSLNAKAIPPPPSLDLDTRAATVIRRRPDLL